VNKRSEQGQATREQLVAVATELFGTRGYEATSIEAVLDAAGVSRGSLYHHFPSKEALFEAAMQAVETRVGEETLAAVEGTTDTASLLRAGCLAWIRIAGDPVVQRIILLDAPSVLGWERWRAIEEEHALGNIKQAMELAALEGRIPSNLVDVFAHTLLATMNELALRMVRADDFAAAQRTAELAVDELLGRLLGAPSAPVSDARPS
jgi:AcrR family transcriptional regulator